MYDHCVTAESAHKSAKACQVLFFAEERGGWWIFDMRKSGELVEKKINHYVNLKWIYPELSLWKPPVEKPVEIVEKFCFSTGKPKKNKIETARNHTQKHEYSFP